MQGQKVFPGLYEDTMTQKTARAVALDALLQMEENEGYSNLVIDKALRSAPLEQRDKALASTIFYGVLEKRLTLDWLLEQCLREPGKRLDPTVHMALRCGAYQICFLDRIPDSAAVNETVAAVKQRGKSSLSGFVNGVLRSLSRKKGELALPDGDSRQALSLRYSVPEELIALWENAYGRKLVLQLLESLGERARLTIRVNTLKTTTADLARALDKQGVSCFAPEFPAGCLELENCGSPAALPQFQEGLFHVQDLSAQLICAILGPQPGETVYDCCAAPGGKTFTMAQEMEDRGQITAFDLYKGRVGLIKDGAERLGISCVTACQADMTQLAEGLPQADKVLCDVPCSGFGVIRRKPEIRYKSLSQVQELPELQFKILKNAASLVKPGGVLVYSTCTLNPRENGGVADRFLKENNGFEPMQINLPGIARTVEEPLHQLTMMPFSGASDGFFAAAFRKK